MENSTNNQLKTHFKTLLSLDPDPRGGSNLKSLWRSPLTSVMDPNPYPANGFWSSKGDIGCLGNL